MSPLGRERERTLDDLSALYEADVIDLEAFSERADRALAAVSLSELRSVLQGLPSAGEIAPDAGGVDPELAEALRMHLLADERLLWCGQPDATKLFTRTDLVQLPFRLGWAVFALFIGASMVRSGSGSGSGGSIASALFGSVITGAGLFVVFGLPFLQRRWKRKTIYAVTSRRVLTFRRRRTSEVVRTVPLTTLPSVNIRVGRDGSGSITVGDVQPRRGGWGTRRAGGPDGNQSPAGLSFLNIPDVTRVAALIEQLQSGSRTLPPAEPDHSGRAGMPSPVWRSSQRIGGGRRDVSRSARREATWRETPPLMFATRRRGIGLTTNRDRTVLAGLVVILVAAVPLVILAAPQDTCASSGISTGPYREGVCVRGSRLFGETTYNVVDSGHTLVMPGYDATLLSSADRVILPPEKVGILKKGSPDVLVSYEVSITNTGSVPLRFDATNRDADLLLQDPSATSEWTAWRQVRTSEGAPTPQIDDEAPLPRGESETGWMSFLIPLSSQAELVTNFADLEFYRPGHEPGYTGQIRLWRSANQQGEEALQLASETPAVMR